MDPNSPPGDGPQQPRRHQREQLRPGLPHVVAACGILFLGIALLVLAFPRTVAAWAALDAAPAMENISYNRPATPQELAACVEGYERSLQWVRSEARLANLASCELAIASAAPPGTPDRVKWLARAEQHLIEGLIDDPADGYAWTRLAVVRNLRGAPGREVAAALVMAIDTTPNTRLLWASARSELLMIYMPFFKLEELYTVRHQLWTIWTYSPKSRPGLVDAAHRRMRMDLLRWALANDKEATAELDMMERQFSGP